MDKHFQFASVFALTCSTFTLGYWVGHRKAKKNAAMWFVQPAPPPLRREPDKTDPNAPVVLDATFVRTNRPDSNSDFG